MNNRRSLTLLTISLMLLVCSCNHSEALKLERINTGELQKVLAYYSINIIEDEENKPSLYSNNLSILFDEHGDITGFRCVLGYFDGEEHHSSQVKYGSKNEVSFQPSYKKTPILEADLFLLFEQLDSLDYSYLMELLGEADAYSINLYPEQDIDAIVENGIVVFSDGSQLNRYHHVPGDNDEWIIFSFFSYEEATLGNTFSLSPLDKMYILFPKGKGGQ